MSSPGHSPAAILPNLATPKKHRPSSLSVEMTVVSRNQAATVRPQQQQQQPAPARLPVPVVDIVACVCGASAALPPRGASVVSQSLLGRCAWQRLPAHPQLARRHTRGRLRYAQCDDDIDIER